MLSVILSIRAAFIEGGARLDMVSHFTPIVWSPICSPSITQAITTSARRLKPSIALCKFMVGGDASYAFAGEKPGTGLPREPSAHSESVSMLQCSDAGKLMEC